ncbi:hypothetical protein [Massilioclostridium coli]|uniref:hypothetical protein n=1 Tax=Massilioclostridium coli TaxID=1870991 RepID=UPI0022E1608D|nr:hypothetical protein [Massilioclostridium coli]
MTKALFENLLDQLEQDLQLEKNHDFIGELCEERAEIMHMSIVKNQEYKQHMNIIKQLRMEIRDTFQDDRLVFEYIEKYDKIKRENQYLYEKQMYKHGVYDGIMLLLEGMKKVDDTSFLELEKDL